MICFTHTFSIPETQFLYIPACDAKFKMFNNVGQQLFTGRNPILRYWEDKIPCQYRQRGNIYLQFIDEGIIYTSLIVYFDELIKVYHPIHRGFKGNNSSGLHLFLQCTHLLNLNFCLSYAYTYNLSIIPVHSLVHKNEIYSGQKSELDCKSVSAKTKIFSQKVPSQTF